jgi:formamidopyrimidine-DNA glycosylase
MPELPEVEIARRQLARWGEGRRVREVIARDAAAIRRGLSTRPSDALPGGAEAVARALVGATAGAPARLGKRIGWRFGEAGLLVHLGMSGKWVRREEPPPHARLGLSFHDVDGAAWFVDPRRFGCVALVPADGLDAALADGLGPDALDAAPDGPGLAARLAGRRPIKVALLDQARLAGVGNIHAVEALWRAGISPHTPCESLDAAAWARLAQAIPAQLRWTVEAEEADEIAYVNEGAANPFAVYARAGTPCRRCGAAIASAILGGRSTFWCPACQG